jgi:diguanylate cyclase (GGDEF)-like protein/PAS domain S-box-containing protein
MQAANRDRCSQADYRDALCSSALQTEHIQYIEAEQNDAEIGTMPPYYSIPIKSGHNILAVMVLFLEPQHRQDLCEIVFLHTIANTFANIIDRHNTEQSLRQSKFILSAAQRIAHMGSWECDIAKQQLRFSTESRHILELDAQETDFGYDDFIQLVHEDDRQRVKQQLSDSLNSGEAFHLQHRIVSRQNNLRTVVINGEVQRDSYHLEDAGLKDNSKATRLVGTIQDISEQLKAQQELQLITSVFEGAQESIMVLDASNKIIRVNGAFCKIFGYSKAEIIGTYIDSLNSQHHDDVFYNEMWSDIENQGSWHGEVWSRRKDGESYPEWRTISTVKNAQGNVERYLVISMDMSDIRQSEERIHQLVYYDALTQLPNKMMFKSVLGNAIEQAHETNQQLAILSLGLDGLKRINDSLGHNSGDNMLNIMANRLRQCVRGIDTVSRWGSDEFVILLTDVQQKENAISVASKILNSLLEPIMLADQHRIVMGSSIGISMYPADGSDALGLIQNADVAMHRAKADGGNGYHVYTAEMNLAVIERLGIETGLRSALELDQFELYYQALMEMDNRKITGAEALIRWNHPKKGLIPPDEFIPIAEECGLIIAIGEWVINRACQQCVSWQQQGLEGINISVNLAARQFNDNNLVQIVYDALQQSGLQPSKLTLEITESSVMHNADQTIEQLHKLKQLGINLSIDDFGTGYSSLAYLKRFPIDILKIDRSFVQEIDINADDRAIVQSIIAMGHSLKLGIVAEGVEKMEQLQFLNTQQCEQAQGYLISKPIRSEKFVEFAKQWHNDAENDKDKLLHNVRII